MGDEVPRGVIEPAQLGPDLLPTGREAETLGKFLCNRVRTVPVVEGPPTERASPPAEPPRVGPPDSPQVVHGRAGQGDDGALLLAVAIRTQHGVAAVPPGRPL